MDDEVATLALRWIAGWRPGRVGELATLAAPDYVHHTMSGQDVDFSGFVDGLERIFTSFPDMRYEVLHSFSEGSYAAVAVVGRATHTGDFLGIRPTGQPVTFRGITHCRFVEGMLQEDWDVFDLLSPLYRLGASVVMA